MILGYFRAQLPLNLKCVSVTWISMFKLQKYVKNKSAQNPQINDRDM